MFQNPVNETILRSIIVRREDLDPRVRAAQNAVGAPDQRCRKKIVRYVLSECLLTLSLLPWVGCSVGSTNLPPITLTSISCGGSSTPIPGTANCSVQMTGVVPDGGVTIGLSSNNPAVRVPASVTVPFGSQGTTFAASVSSGAAAGTVTLTGTFNGISKSIQLQIVANAPSVALGSVTCTNSSVSTPGSDTCSVSMTGPAPAGGLGVTVASSAGGVSVPSLVVVPVGSTTAGFTASVSSGLPAETVSITGAFNQVSKIAQLQILGNSSTIAVAVTPKNISLLENSSQQFSASVSGASNSAVTWTVSGSGCSGNSCGVISSTGLYTAPGAVPSPPNVTIKATSQQDSSKSTSASVAITAPAATLSGTTYYVAPASSGGNDRNDGLSANAPWLTPNHPLNCGDIVLAAPGIYDAQNFIVGSWGVVSCPAANNVVWLKCATFDTCYISTSSLSAGMWVDRSYWGVQGWEISTQKGGAEPTCFVVAPNWNNSIEVHHVILANNVANGCLSGGFSSANHPGEMVGVDYLAIVGNIAYNTTQGQGECFTGISVYAPIESDSLPGTHVYLAGNFAWDNYDPSYCAGGAATDGEGLMFDWVDGSSQGLPTAYAGQLVADNNILIGNGGPGLQVDHNNAGSGPWAKVYTRHNTMWGNNLHLALPGIHGEMLWGTVKNTQSSYDLAVPTLQSDSSGYPMNGLVVADSPGTSSISNGWIYSPWANNTQVVYSAGFAYGSSNTFGVDPRLTNPSIPGVPNCKAYSSVTACMATVIGNFTPQNPSAKGYGYQQPSNTYVSDPLFPKWLCSITNFPRGLVTMGCAQ